MMCSRNPFIALCVSDRSRGAVLIFRWLAQPSRHFGPVSLLSLWRGAYFEIARASLSALWACQIALIVAWCSFSDGSHNPVGTLGVSDRSRCGAVLILMVKEILYRELFWRSFCTERSYRDLANGPLIESLYKDRFKGLAKRPLIEILYRDRATAPILEILRRDVA